MTDARPFLRDALVRIGDEFEVTGLRIAFTVERNLKAKPNTAEISIYNLNRESRDLLQGQQDLIVTLEAGYVSTGRSVIYRGDLREVNSVPDGGGNWVTRISSGDGENAHRSARSHRAYKPGIAPKKMLKDIAGDLGVGAGNLLEAVGDAAIDRLGKVMKNGINGSGTASKVLRGVLGSMGKEHSIQGGEIQVLDRGKARAGAPAGLSPATGLIGVPTVDNKGQIEATSLLRPDLTPGTKLTISDSVTGNGTWKLSSCTHVGDTHGSDWYVEMEGKAA